MSKILVDTIDTRSGTATMTIGSTNTTTLALKSGATLTNFPENTPSFSVKLGSNQTISNASDTKINLDTENWDTDSAFASNKFTVPSGKAGKYLISYSVRDLATTKAIDMQTTIAIDGTRDNVPLQDWNFDLDYEAKIFTMSITIIKDLSVGEAVTLQHYATSNGGSPQIREFGTYLSIMRIIT